MADYFHKRGCNVVAEDILPPVNPFAEQETTYNAKAEVELKKEEKPKRQFLGIFAKKNKQETAQISESAQKPAPRNNFDDLGSEDAMEISDLPDFPTVAEEEEAEEAAEESREAIKPKENISWTDEKAVPHFNQAEKEIQKSEMPAAKDRGGSRKKAVKQAVQKTAVREEIPEETAMITVPITDRLKFHREIDEAFEEILKKHEKLQKELQSATTPSQRKLYEIKNAESIKELLNSMYELNPNEFRKFVTSNKASWIKIIKNLLKEIEKNEKAREQILKKNLLSAFEEHKKIISNHILDKKKELDIVKKSNDKIHKDLSKEKQEYDKRLRELDKREKELVEKELNFDDELEKGIQKELEKRFKKEKKNIDTIEASLADIKEKYLKKLADLRLEESKLKQDKEEAHDILRKAEALRKKREGLEQREQYLEKNVDTLGGRYSEIKSMTEELDRKERELREKDLALKKEVESLQKRKELLAKSDSTLEQKSAYLGSKISSLERKERELERKNQALKQESEKLNDFKKRAEDAERVILKDLDERRKIKTYIDTVSTRIKDEKKEL
ncbi:MAG: hypothetical protein V1659_00845, partial [Candidatus Woesearchaeota archaeon]